MRGTEENHRANYLFHLEDMFMLHDRVMSKTNPAAGAWEDKQADSACAERRHSDRVPFPAELILAWNHDTRSPVRYRVIDAGDGGYRIQSSMPMLEGTTGMVVRLLPGRGEPIGQPVMVAWSRPADEGAGFDIGLRFF